MTEEELRTIDEATLRRLEEVKEELEAKMLKCHATVNTEIHTALVEVNRLSEHLDAFKKEASATFTKHEMQRVSFNKSIEDKLDKLEEWFENHNENEMAKYDRIIELLEATAEESDNNAQYISKLELEEVKKKAIKEANAPRDAIWGKVKMVALTVVVGGITTGIMSALWFGFKMYVALNLGSVE
mgnify:CR=1 FL=1